MVEWAWSAQVAGLGESDCEAIGDSFFAQPVNATTSFAYVAAGLGLVVKAFSADTTERTGELIYASTLIAIGLGSVAFHGPQPPGSQFFHDVPIAAALLYISLGNLRHLGRLRHVGLSFLGLAIPVAAIHGLAPSLGQIIAAALAGAAIVTEILVFRSDGNRKARRLEAAAAGFLVLAGLGYSFGRTGSAMCDPNSLWQAHGLWHVLSAAAFMVWGLAASVRNQAPLVRSDV